MRVLAMYTTESLSILRRIMTPFHTLAERQHTMHFVQTSFTRYSATAYDLVVLPNWVLSDGEMDEFMQLCSEKQVVYDLSDPTLLESERVREMLQMVAAVTVPNERFAKVIRAMGVRTHVTPSGIRADYFAQGRSTPPSPHPTIGCFGPHDWDIVLPVLQKVKEAIPPLVILADRFATPPLAAYGLEGLSVDLNTQTYPSFLRKCWLGLCPLEGGGMIDTSIAYEYGMLSVPVVSSASSQYDEVIGPQGGPPLGLLIRNRNTEAWTTSIIKLLTHKNLLSRLGSVAFDRANAHRSTKTVDTVSSVYRALMPATRVRA